MPYTLDLKDTFKFELKEITVNINNFKGSVYANNFITGLYSELDFLVLHPHIYSLYYNSKLQDMNIHRFLYEHYRIFYEVDENSKIISILHIIHESRDIDPFFRTRY